MMVLGVKIKMPSWNIHIAQAERVFASGGAVARTVRDRNAFLFGCLVPDIYVGYMVPAIEHPIAYRITHFATPAHIPKPREGEFFETYVAPMARRLGIRAGARSDSAKGAAATADGAVLPAGAAPILPASLVQEQEYVGRVHYPQRYEGTEPLPAPGTPADNDCDDEALEATLFDLVLGTWLHLMADNLWNTRVNELLDAHGNRPSEGFRIKKQHDFDVFGKALPIDSVPRATPRLIAAAATFPQYPIDERALLSTIAVAHEIVRTNEGDGEPHYRMLTSDFFEHVFMESVTLPNELLAERL